MNVGTFFKDIGKGLAWPFVHAAAILGILDKALKDEPVVKDAVTGLIQQIATITADGAIVISGSGVNLTADMAELVAAKALWQYVTATFIPAIETVWKDIAPQVQALEPATDDKTASAPQPGPGLHNVVAP